MIIKKSMVNRIISRSKQLQVKEMIKSFASPSPSCTEKTDRVFQYIDSSGKVIWDANHPWIENPATLTNQDVSGMDFRPVADFLL